MNKILEKIIVVSVICLVGLTIFNNFAILKVSNDISETNLILSEGKFGLASPSATFGNIFSTMSTSSALTITTSSTFIIATSSTRQYCGIVNDGDYRVYLSFNDIPATANSSLMLVPGGGNYEINLDNLYKGAIRGIAVGGNSVITISCKE